MAKTNDTATLPADEGHPGAARDAVAAALVLQGMMAEPFYGPDEREYVSLPADFKLHELPNRYQLPPRPQVHLTVDDRLSLVHYANRFSDTRSVLIADYDEGTITAHLDWHPHNKDDNFGSAGANAHKVTLKLRQSEEFQRWNAISAKLMPQDEFAHFLEENSADIGYPEAADLVEISRDFEATIGQTYKTSTRLQNGDRKIVFESESNVESNVTVPDRFTISIPIYNGEEPTDLTALFRWRGTNGKVLLGFEWHRVEYARRAHFDAIATQAAEETGLPVFRGR